MKIGIAEKIDKLPKKSAVKLGLKSFRMGCWFGHVLYFKCLNFFNIPFQKLKACRAKVGLFEVGMFDFGGGVHYAVTASAVGQAKGMPQFMEHCFFNTCLDLVERHNLMIRQGCSYLHRRTAAHARWPHRLQEHLELLRCHYNFIRPHMALQFGTIRRTPAMQAGLTSKPLTFRQIFTSRVLLVFVIWARN